MTDALCNIGSYLWMIIWACGIYVAGTVAIGFVFLVIIKGIGGAIKEYKELSSK